MSGIDPERVTRWLCEQVPEVRPPLQFQLIAGGYSNLTFSVIDDAGVRRVLRRPPLGSVLATAHDMGREFRIISALAPTAVPVPDPVAFCEDETVIGAPFFVMSYVDGTVVRDTEVASALEPPVRRRVSKGLVDVLADLHALDVDAVGLGSLGRRENYVERQLWRWSKQWEQSKTREVPVVEEVHRRLSASVPPQVGVAIVHGDYRLDNALASDEGRIVAVLDWELCTLGDALADVGLLLVYWVEPGEDPLGLWAPSAAGDFLTRAELLDRYALRSGRDVSDIAFYVALGQWKLACINEGVYARILAGALGDQDLDADAVADQVVRRAEIALDMLRQRGTSPASG